MPAVQVLMLVAPLLTPVSARAEAAATEAARTAVMCLCLMATSFLRVVARGGTSGSHVVDEREELGRADEAAATPSARSDVLDDTVQVCRDRVGYLGRHPYADYERFHGAHPPHVS